MKNKRKIFPLLIASFMLSSAFFSYADDIAKEDVKLIGSPNTEGIEVTAEGFTADVVYQTYDQGEDALKHIAETVEVNGVSYAPASAEDPKYIRKDSVKPDSMNYVSEVWTGDGEEQKPEEEMTVEGKTYYLKTITKESAETEERTEVKEASVSYTGIEDGVNIPESRTITFTDKDTKQEVDATIPLKESKVVKEYWDDSLEFPITISGYNADSYMLGSKTIPASDPLIDHASDFMSLLSLNPDKYEITSIEWKGAEYNDNGVIKRDAVGKGRKLVQDIDAVYEGEVTLPESEGYVWNCEYEEEIPESELTAYTMSAKVTFAPVNAVAEETSFLSGAVAAILGVITAAYTALAASFAEHPVITSLPFVILACLIAFLITRKAMNRCVYDRSKKCMHKKHNAEMCKSCPNFYNKGKAPKAKIDLGRFSRKEADD